MEKLPKSLDKEPLVEAVFEARLGGEPQLSDILPGALFGQLEPKPVITRLSAAEIPRQLRANERNLIFTPVLRLELEKITIDIGDRNLVIGSKLPYPKWPTFKKSILDITNRIAEIGISGPVERYSIKYVNLIEARTIAEQIQKIAMSIRLGDLAVNDEHVSLKVHQHENDTLHLMSVLTGAQAKMVDGKQVAGVVVDIDSIRDVEFPDFNTFVANLEPKVESLRQANKAKFFGCLTKAAIQEMGPQYD